MRVFTPPPDVAPGVVVPPNGWAAGNTVLLEYGAEAVLTCQPKFSEPGDTPVWETYSYG